MNKLLIVTWCCLSGSQLIAQQRIDFLLQPSFDAPAMIHFQPVTKDTLLLIFKQTGKNPRATNQSIWGDDTTRLIHIRRMGRYFQQFAFSDTIRLSNQAVPLLFKSYQKLLSQVKALAAYKDERLLTDGLRCQLTIYDGSSTPYQFTYRTPVEKDTQIVNQLIKNILLGLKMKSQNPATVNYSMIANGYMY